jgi:RHS repeat-associated protein
VFQSGAPIKTEYIDRLGRAIAAGVEGFDGREVITVVGYNSRGAKIAEYQPWKNSSAPWLPGAWDGLSVSPYVTRYSGIDTLGRVGRKDVTRGLAFETGRGDATLSTTYTYKLVASGLQTIVAVAKPVSQGGNINMSRTYDRGGKLIETTQDVSTPSPHSISAHYFYDPAGNLTMIVDSAPTPNKLTAAYDNLGRKTSVVDPDRGTWTYAWDGLGRLGSQTDSKGIITSHKYDGIGRMLQRFVKTSADPAPVPESTLQYDLNGKLGTVGAMIGNENPAAGADNFRRDYLYDPLLRPFRVTTHVPAGTGWAARDFAVEYGYDHGYGRLKAMSYPGPDVNTPGEIAAFDYDSRGNLLGETALTTTGARDMTYRTVGDMSVRGQVTSQTFGNRIKEAAEYDESTGMALLMKAYDLADVPPTPCTKTRQYLVRQVDYTYDHYLNLAKQAKQFLLRNGIALQFSGCTEQGATATEGYQYDELQRLMSGSRSWTGMTPAPAQYADQYAYDDLGNITTKNDYADLYTYGRGITTVDAAGPHAVVSVSKGGVTKATFSYDPNGNLFAGDGRTVTFDNLDRPIRVTLSGVTTEFHYAPDGSRYLQRTTGIPSSPTAKTVYYVDKDYERIEWPASTEEKTYIGPSVTIYRNGATRDVRYLHLDRLGSTDAVTDGGGFEYLPDAHGFDAFGKPRARDWQWSSEKLHPSGDYNVTTEHGFTKHEHLDDTYLIHMNGRMYDYRLGRFLSVDPIISHPANSQSINPYSYIGNNPLSGVDPTGYMDECTQLTGSHQCNTVAAGSNLTINGIPVNAAGNLNIQKSASNNGGGNNQSGVLPNPNPPDHGKPGTDGTATASAPNRSANLSTIQKDSRTFWDDVKRFAARFFGTEDSVTVRGVHEGGAVACNKGGCFTTFYADGDPTKRIFAEPNAVDHAADATNKAILTAALPFAAAGAAELMATRGATTLLYRAVSSAEADQLLESGVFRAGTNSFDGGKWFAESAEHATQWGRALEGPGNFRVIEVRMPTKAADQLMRVPRLDGIGPARYGELDQLNGRGAVIREVK